MNIKDQATKRGRGRPAKSEEERLNEGKFTVYLDKKTLKELMEMSKQQGLPYSQFARQGIKLHINRFRRAA